ncbi:MAG: DUF3131 domain-containing protein [Oscillospiraceae bacterium]|nr:DUF3131 domain-containing protein [Oscillospiraceae bacterium]
MNITELINEKTAAAFAENCQRTQKSPALLARSLSKKLRKLRRLCEGSSDTEKNVSETWLSENYYLLEREGKGVLRELKAAKKDKVCPVKVLFGNSLPMLNRIFEAVYGRGMHIPVTEESLTNVLAAAAKEMELNYSEERFAPLALRICLINRAADFLFDCSGGEDDLMFVSKALHGIYIVDFAEVFAKVSRTEQLLLSDPSDVYRIMDEDSRSYYRRSLAELAAKEGKTETETAEKLLRLAKEGKTDTERHIGYWLLRKKCSSGLRGRLALALPPAAAAAAAVWIGLVLSPLAGAAVFLPIWETVRQLCEWLFMRRVAPSVLPRIALKRAGCSNCSTVVAVSTLMPKVQDAPRVAAHLKKLRLANEVPGLHFCLLADFKESNAPKQPDDGARLGALKKEVAELNREFGGGFSLFVREREYCRTQGKFCGRERKRGAITDLVSCIGGDMPVNCSVFPHDGELKGKQKLIVLDADTELLFDTAEKLIGAAVHPLNMPILDTEQKRVTSGYGIIVPKLTVSLQSAGSSLFAQIMAGCGGVTPYDVRTNDIYQDLFGASLFSGKGIIDVAAFACVMQGRLPKERVLSHDVAEGEYLRTALLSDAELTESFPADPLSWHSRLHRWVRGDWQNLFLLFRRELSALSRYKLFDNLRRSLVPVSCFFSAVVSAFLLFADKEDASLAAAAAVVLPTAAVPLARMFIAFFHSCASPFPRKYFSHIIPTSAETLCRILLTVIFLPYTAIITLDAVFRALWRSLVSKKRLLQWVTAAESTGEGGGFAAVKRYFLPTLFGVLLLLVPSLPLKIYGALFAAIIPAAGIVSRRRPEQTLSLTAEEREYIGDHAARIWSFFEEYAAVGDNWLPPDNVQQAPVYAVAHRTSPTNIGLCLLSALAARDLDLIDSRQLAKRLQNTLDTVEKLEKWRGNLYNWYDTVTLEVLKPAYLSAVDSGNLLCCLVALKEGLKEYSDKEKQLCGLISRIEKLIEDTDIGAFYNEKRHLFSIGYDPEEGSFSQSFYDFLMSEARMTSYFAVAARRVEKRHWAALSRAMSRLGRYAGPMSWTGTMFEYYMPSLLLPNVEGSLLSEGLKYSYYCQRRRLKGKNPWGISESAFYSFDRSLCYQYKAHGVQRLGVKRGLDSELVISPYSSFLTLPFYPYASIKNLRRLEKLGMCSDHGFFEALDLTEGRSGICRSYMSHHLGMSMVACANALFGGVMCRRFISDPRMNSARELLEERPDRDTAVLEEIRQKYINEAAGKNRNWPAGKGNAKMNPETIAGSVDPNYPNVTVLSNGELCDILSDSGENRLMLAQADVTRRTVDSLRSPQGIYVFAACGEQVFSLTEAPFYDENIKYGAEIGREHIKYSSSSGELACSVEVCIHEALPIEQRVISVKNISDKKRSVELLVYFEPVLQPFCDYAAHPAFSKLFVTAERDAAAACVVFSRKAREGKRAISVAAGFDDDGDFEFETRREKLFFAPKGFEALKSFVTTDFRGGKGIPDCCFAAKLKLCLAPGQRITRTLFISAGSNRAECTANIVRARLSGIKLGKNAAQSPVFNSTAEGRIAFSLLPELIYPMPSPKTAELAEKNTLGTESLWALSISGDHPILLYSVSGTREEAMEGFFIRLRMVKLLRECRIEFDTVVLFSGEALPNFLEEAGAAAAKMGCGELFGINCGVHCINSDSLSENVLRLLKLTASCSISDNVYKEPKARGFRHPKHLLPITAADIEKLTPKHRTYGGIFTAKRFYSTRCTPLPYCHVLASPTFGTLVSDGSPGFSWAVNSRENKLSPWSNDFAADNGGELLVLKDSGGKLYSLTKGALFSCSAENARWEGHIDRLKLVTEISLPPKGAKTAKVIDVTLSNTSEKEVEFSLAYYFEPLLSAGSSDYRMKSAPCLKTSFTKGVLTVENPMNTLVRGTAALSCSLQSCRPVWDRAAFLAGEWDSAERGSELCAALAVTKTLPPKKELHIRFALSFAAKSSAAKLLVSDWDRLRQEPHLPLRRFEISTPDKQLDSFINGWCVHQARVGRSFARSSFWQNGGAYGFRDQLQDAVCLAAVDPKLLKRQIFRCCAVQFTQGDVLHWWHRYPKAIRGVRTRISDDLLWLPYAVSEYVEKTGDMGILDKEIAYLEGEPLAENEKDRYFQPQKSSIKESVYHHCLRAVSRFGTRGDHGLPLIGSGDWNDSFSSVGAAGRGESVWLAMFLRIVALRFAKIAERRNDGYTASSMELLAEQLKQAVESKCWDGRWYLRAFYDDGSPMGGSGCSECRIDSLVQSFAALSEISDDDERIDGALTEALERLTDSKSRTVRLFTPPFENTVQEPGYVKAYPPGIRENGGQYTHAAVWLAMALFKRGRAAEGSRILEMLNPVARCSDYDLNKSYLLEPYQIAADIYSGSCSGRGGWSIYTGAAGWYFRGVTESMLGLKIRSGRLFAEPNIPSEWSGFEVSIARENGKTELTVVRAGRRRLTVDGEEAESIPLEGDHTAILEII